MAESTRFVVGWINRQEWEEIRRELFGFDRGLQYHAMKRMEAWMSRMMQNTPAAIDSTVCLISAILEDHNACQKGLLSLKEHQIRLNHGIAIIRFINNLTEMKQNRQYNQPINVLAEKLGIPEWLVDVRHEVAHSCMPSIDILRTAVNTALDWLKAEYWDSFDGIQQDESQSHVGLGTKETLKTFLSKYFSMKEQKNITDIEVLNIMKEDEVKLDSDVFFMLLLEEGYMIPSETQIKLMNINTEDILNSGLSKLPDMMISLWSQVLRILHHLNLVHMFVLHMVKQLDTEINIRNRFIVAWALLLTSDSIRNLYSTIDKKGGKGQPSFNWKQLLTHAVKNASSMTKPLIDRIANNLELSHSQKIQIKKLTSVYLGTLGHDKSEKEAAEEKDDQEKIDQSQKQSVTEVSQSQKQSDKSKTWQLCDELEDWSSILLGSVPNEVEYDFTALDLPAELDDNIQQESPMEYTESMSGS